MSIVSKDIKIDSGVSQVEGGGYNCRHVFVPIDVEDKSKDFRREDA